jgi:hypothetical protein
MKNSGSNLLRSRKATILTWFLAVCVSWLVPSVPAIAGASLLLQTIHEQTSESTGNERDEAASFSLSGLAARRGEIRREKQTQTCLAERRQFVRLTAANAAEPPSRLGEHLHRNGIGAPLRR